MSNAFNSINCQNALCNIHSQCPALATAVINCYRLNLPLFIDGDVIFSAEGTTQGEPLAMIFYAIGILPLIHHLDEKSCSQIWYADDVAACGRISTLRGWWDGLCLKGLGYRYFPNASKSWLIVKPAFWDLASSTFAVTDVNITTEGHRYLGSAIGSPAFVSNFIFEKVSEWVSQLDLLTSIAQSHPHAAYSAFVRGLFSKWTYFLRTTPNMEDYLAPLESCLCHQFLPNLTGQSAFNGNLRSIMSLPTWLGGLGIVNPFSTAKFQYKSSLFTTSPLVSLLLHQFGQSTITQEKYGQIRTSLISVSSSFGASVISVYFSETMYGSSQRERCFHMVDCTSPQMSWICSPQRCLRDELCLQYG